jgi:hypothetical protein
LTRLHARARFWRSVWRPAGARAALLLLGVIALWAPACVAGRGRGAPEATPARAVARDPRACVEPALPDEPSLAASRGRIAPAQVESVAAGELARLRGCYGRALARSARAAGQINVHFVIGLDGRVSHARAEHNGVPDCDAVRCVLDVFRGMRFPAPDGGSVHVVYPILLAPG